MWTAPEPQGFLRCWSGSLAVICPVSRRSQDRLPRWVPQIGSEQARGITADSAIVLDGFANRWIDRSIHLSFLAVLRPYHRRYPPVSILSGSLCYGRTRSIVRPIAFAARHHLPCSPRHFAGKRHRGEFRRLAVDQIDQPCRVPASALAHLLNDRSGARHQQAAQLLVARTRYPAQPRLAGGGVILGRKPDPAAEVSSRSEDMRVRHLHHQRCRSPRANAGNSHKSPTARVLPMPVLRQDQTLDAAGSGANCRRHLATHRSPGHNHPTHRMPQLLPKRRVCFRQNMKRSSGDRGDNPRARHASRSAEISTLDRSDWPTARTSIQSRS